MREMSQFVDTVRLSVRAGDGGHGCIAFLRLKGQPWAGPAGGDGGRGGSVIFEAERELGTLIDLRYRPSIIAPRGQNGSNKNCTGRSGEDVVVKVPLGTTIVDADSGEELGDLLEHGQRLVVAKGGDGGLGNQHYATATNRSPRKALDGFPGEHRNLLLELKIIADVGLLGMPNAGKSTLLAALTHANPKIAPYPFTTLSPNLGVFLATDFKRRITLADIPGLIEGASKGAGLGHRFLRHIERTRALVHLVAPESGEGADGELTMADPSPEAILYAYKLVREEMAHYSRELLKKPCIVCLNKVDLLKPDQVAAIVAAFKTEHGFAPLTLSARGGIGLDVLKLRLEKLVLELDAAAALSSPTHAPKENRP